MAESRDGAGGYRADYGQEQVLRQRDDNPLKPVHSNMVENLREEVIAAYETALAENDKDTIKRMEWELGTLSIHKKELKEYVARRARERKERTPSELYGRREAHTAAENDGTSAEQPMAADGGAAMEAAMAAGDAEPSAEQHMAAEDSVAATGEAVAAAAEPVNGAATET